MTIFAMGIVYPFDGAVHHAEEGDDGVVGGDAVKIAHVLKV
jgi:hypothetical protein